MNPSKVTRPARWLTHLPFVGVHAGCALAYWTGITPVAAGLAAATLLARMFGLTAGYHRYFCHRSFKTSRTFQFVLAWLGASAAQMGPLWWAAHHRRHHRTADTADDVHPPGVRGIAWAHAGWILSPDNQATRFEWVQDLARFPELRWVDRYHYFAPVSLGVSLFVLGSVADAMRPEWGVTGWQLVAAAFFISTTALYHLTFAVNSVGHTFGSRRYETSDESRNVWWLALITGGEGWHNNHHRFPASERQGFYWWEIDPTHYGVALLGRLGIVWDIKGPSASVLDEGRRGATAA